MRLRMLRHTQLHPQKQSLFERLMGSMARTGSNKGSLAHPHTHSHPNSNSGSTTIAASNQHGSGTVKGEEVEAHGSNNKTATEPVQSLAKIPPNGSR